MKNFEIIDRGRQSAEPFSSYLFDVLFEGRKLAELSHDYRGDEHWIRKPGGSWVTLAERVVHGGGPQTLELSAEGIRIVERMMAG